MEGRRKYQGRRGYTLYKNGPFWHAFFWILHLHTFVAHVHRTYQKKKIISDMFLIWNTLFWGPILCNFQISNREGNSLNAPRLKTRWNTKSFKTLTCPIVLKIWPPKPVKNQSLQNSLSTKIVLETIVGGRRTSRPQRPTVFRPGSPTATVPPSVSKNNQNTRCVRDKYKIIIWNKYKSSEQNTNCSHECF